MTTGALTETDMQQGEISTGEVFRKLEDMDARYTKAFDEIWRQVKLTNGRVNKHDVTIGILWWALGLVGGVAMLAMGALIARVLQ